MKLDKELYTKHAKRLQAILNEKSTFAPYIARPDFSKVIEVSLNTLAAIERILTKVELPADLSAKSLAKDFNKLGKNTFKIDEKYKYGDEGDLIDNINYLFTYCNNIYKVNLDDLVEGKKVTPANPNINLKGKTDVEEMPDAAAMGAGFAGAEMGMGGFANPFIMGQAFAKVKQDIMSGKLYTYKTKPKSIIISKIIEAIGLGLAVLALIISAIFAIKAGDYQVKYSDGSINGLRYYAIGPGIVYIFISLFGIYPLYQTISSLVTTNENTKYNFNWPWILMFVLLAALFVMPDMRVTWLLTADAGIAQQATPLMCFKAWKIMYIISLSLLGLCLVPMIIGAVNNPKQDENLLNAKVKEYADELMASGGGFGSGAGGQPAGGSADVQKPVDVKKTDTKHKKESKDSSKDKK